MRLLVDLQPLQGPSVERGIGNYALSLTRALATTRGDHELVVLLDAERSADEVLRVRHRLAPHVRRGDVVLFEAPPVATRVPGRPDAELAREAAVAALAPDVVLLTSAFELAPLAPMSIARWCADVPTAAVLHDLIPLSDLDLYKPDPTLRREYLAGVDELVRADLLLTNSDHTASEARRLLRGCPPLVTIYGAAAEAQAPRAPRDAPRGAFALAVGRDEPRKDIATAVLAWAGLPRAVRAGRPFVVVGEWPQENRLRLSKRAVAAGLSASELHFAGQVDDHELAWLLEQAEVFIFPSLVEGLGLPPLEAMRAGTPALLARASSLVELLDDSRAYFAPGDVPDLRRLLEQVLTDPALRSELVEAGHRAVERFTWTRSAQATWAALEHLGPTRRSTGVLTLTWVVVGGPSQAPVTTCLPDAYEVRVCELHDLADWPTGWRRQDRTVYELRAGAEWSVASDALADAPGVVVLSGGGPLPDDVAVLLAPALAVLVPTPADRTALLRAGVVDVPVVVVDLTDAGAVSGALEHAYATDLGTHWARGAARVDGRVDPAPVERRPRWAVAVDQPVLLASDVTVYRTTPFMSGIQRTTARLHHALTDLLQERGGAVVPVQLGVSPEGTAHPDIRADHVLSAATVEPERADWLLCLDLNSQLATALPQVQAARARGVGVAVNVFDLIPHTHPHWFPPGAAQTSFTPWLHKAVAVADVLLVNSRATARELERFVLESPPRRADAFTVALLPLGCDFDEASDVEVAEREPAHFLMVGTVEPRKGHRAVLDAVEQLWAQGAPVRLTVLGRRGWMVDEVCARMERLTAVQPRFSWLQNASDSELDRLYRTCTAAVVASEGEGFGLPVVEAALRGCPVVVHDIPVLREVAGDDATFFSDRVPLAAVLADVLAGAPVAQASRAGLRTWREVGERLVRVLHDDEAPLARWTPEHGWAWS